jgi:ribokinase
MPWKDRKPPEIVILGDVNVDLIGLTKSWPRPGEECLAEKLELHCGGVGANCALALRQWSVTPKLIACVGHDPLGQMMLARLALQGVDVRHVQRTRQALTGLLYINVTPGGQRTFFGSRGANCYVQRHPGRSPLLRSATAAALMGYSFLDATPERAAHQLIEAVHNRGGWVALDVGMEPSQKIPGKILQVAKKIDLLFVSSEEAAALTGARNPREAFRKLQQTGAHEIVIKAGKRGCLIADQNNLQLVPAFAVRVVDSTGAGDAFTAAFLQARLRGWPVLEAAIAANAAGAVAATTIGAGDNSPTPKQIANVLRSQNLAPKWDSVRRRALQRTRRLM